MFNYMFKDLIPVNKMDANTGDIISKLKFVGRIQKGEKINVRYMYVQPDSWITRISRTLFACDSRMNAYHFIENIFKRAFEIVSLNTRSPRISDRMLVSNVTTDIKEALKGVHNLKETYSLDVMFCCKLDTLIQDTDSRLAEFESVSTIDRTNMEDPD